jgi:replication initiation and membrane attachment protein DnaB
VAGVEGTIRVHAHFFMSDISQTEQQLGSFSDNPTRYHREYLRLTQAYALTWSDIYSIINATITEDEKDRMWKAVEQCAHYPNRHRPTAEAVCKTKPQCSYQDWDPGSNSRDHMIYLLAGMDKTSHKQVNYNKIKVIPKSQDENLPSFLIASWRQ